MQDLEHRQVEAADPAQVHEYVLLGFECIGETLLHDRERLSDAVGPDSQVFVMQALSGG